MRSRRPGRYEFVQPLGTGPYGAVTLARDRFGGLRDVALKVLDQKALPARAFIRIQREFRIRHGLRHPHVAAFLDLDFDDAGNCRLVSEHVSGSDFLAAIAAAPAEQLPDFAVQLLQALGHLHDCGLVHGAIKPTNVLVANEGGVPCLKLLDFDLRPDHEISPAAPANTLWYAAPEVLRGQAADARSDLYGAGMLLFHAIAGNLPFDDPAHSPGVVAWHLSRDVVRTPGGHVLAPIVERLLDPDPDRRFLSTHEVVRAVSVACGRKFRSRAAPGGEQVLISGRFAGREREMKRLTAACRRLVNGGGAQIFLLTGPQGIGKSRVLDEGRVVAQMAGIRVVRAGCRGELAAPLGVVRELLHQLLLLMGTDHPVVESHRGVLETVAPEMWTDEDGPSRRVEPGTDWMRIQNGVAEFFAAAAQSRPLAMLVDDVGLIDEASLGVLRWIFQHLSGAPVILLGAADDLESEESTGSPARALEGEAHEVLRLGALGIPEVEHILSGVLALPGSVRELTGLILRLTGGVPACVEELLRALLEGQMLEMLAESSLGVAEETPAQARERAVTLVCGRIDRLPPLSRAILEGLALFEGVASDADLAAATGLRAGEIETAVRRLESADFVRLDPTSSGMVVTIRNGLYRGAIARRLPPERLAAMHDAVVDALSGAGPSAEQRAALAHHALRGTRPTRAIPLCTEAAREAMAFHAFGRARALLERARSLATGESDGCARREALRLLAETLQRLGDLEASLLALHELASDADAPKEEVAAARVTTGEIQLLLGWVPAAERTLAAASDEAAKLGDPVLLSRALRARARPLARGGSPTKALALLESARELLAQADSPRDLASLAAEIGEAHAALDDQEIARRWHRESLGRCLELRDRAGIALAHLNLGLVEWNEGRNEPSIARLKRSENIARRLGHYPLLATALLRRGIVEGSVGRLADALRTLTHAVHLMRRLEDEVGICDSLEYIGRVHLAAGRHEMARMLVEEVITRRGRLNDLRGVAAARVLLGRILGAVGAYDEAETLLRTGADAAEQLGIDAVGIAALHALAEIAVRRDRHDEALAILARMDRAWGDALKGAAAVSCDLLRAEIAARSETTAVAAARALVAGALRAGRARRQAEALGEGRRLAGALRAGPGSFASLQAARRIADRAGFRDLGWRVRADLGRMLLEQGDASRAVAVMKEAMKMLRALHDELPVRRRETYLSDPRKHELRASFARAIDRIGVPAS